MKYVTSRRGFTIVELMISTAVFSLILLVILTAIAQVGRMYYKGITTAKAQETARGLVDRISQEIQYSGGVRGNPQTYSATNNETQLICIGTSRYFYIINQVVGGNKHGVWFDNEGLSGCSSAVADAVDMSSATPTQNGSELLPDGARIVEFYAQTAGSPALWAVRAKVVIAADDLIESVAPDGTVVSQTDFPPLTVCKGSQIGTQFCAFSDIETTVLKRLE